MNLQFPRVTFVDDARASVRNIVAIVNDVLSTLQAKLVRVPLVEYVAVTASSAANVPFIVSHSLGVKPTMFTWQSEDAATCYATSADKREWSAERIKIRCDAANSKLVVRVEAA